MRPKFQTEVAIPKYKWKMSYLKPSLFFGSCFTENIGGKMEALKYPVDINPFGILYNPVSVAHGLRILLQKRNFSESELIQNDGLWHSFYHHSRFSAPEADKVLEAINDRVGSSSHFLKNAGFLFLTFGTAWVYEYKATGQTVSNCHKIPEKSFRRFRLTPGEIVEDYRQLLTEIWKINDELKVIFTVSPIRHWKDGAIENQRSKATLILAIDQIISGFGEERCNYFPSYEIMMDELRDYRYYNEDMIHLSVSSANHIWEIFQEALIEEESKRVADRVEKIIASINHKPFNKFTPGHLNFLKQSLYKTERLQEKYPYLDMKFEKISFSEQIAEITKRST